MNEHQETVAPMIKALLIEQDSSSAGSLSATLVPFGISCICAVSSKQALRTLETDYGIDIVIVPMQNNFSGAPDVLKAIREVIRYQYIPVIITSSNCSAEIVVESLRQGATDVLTLPTPEDQIARRIKAAVEKGKRKILVVDDEQVIRDYLKDLLNMERFTPIVASSAVEALDTLKTTTVHAVVSDIMMPGLSGMELLVQIKGNYANLPVILITGYAGRYTPQEAMAAGADGYFLKPFKNVDLIRTLRGVFSTNSTRSRASTAPIRR